MSKIRVLVVDDHPILCDGIQSVLTSCSDVEVVGQAHDGRQAIDRVEELRPDVVIMDIAMPKMNGIEATRVIRDKYPETRILILTQHEDRQYILPLLKAGAGGIVLKQALVADLVNGLRAVARGATFLCPSVESAVIDEFKRQPAFHPVALRSLSPREQEVLEHIVRGETSQEIAHALGVSIKTVEFHRGNLMSKLEVRNVADLVRQALRHGLVVETN